MLCGMARIAIIGGGSIGEALLAGLLRAGRQVKDLVVAYGKILPADLLAVPRHGCWNVHASLLPRYRGAAPIQWSILSGDTETGVTLMQMDVGLDTGDMLLRRAAPIAA